MSSSRSIRGVLNRLRTVLRVAGESTEADRMDQKFIAYQAAFKQMREVYSRGPGRSNTRPGAAS